MSSGFLDSGIRLKGFPFEAMVEDEPDYASLRSRGGPPSEEAPHPFWSEWIQDEFRLQQARPRELDRLANRDDRDGENMLGMEGLQGQEPPYGSPELRSVHEGLIREAVADVLAENEILRRRVTDLENFSSARTGSTRQYQSTTSRSAELRSPEPDYSALDQLAEEDGLQGGQVSEPSLGNTSAQVHEDRQPRSLFSGLMERTRAGSAERWNALRSFLRFQPRETETASRPQDFPQTADASSRYDGIGSRTGRDRSPGRPGNPWDSISGSVSRRDPIVEGRVAGSSLRVQGFESASMNRPQRPVLQAGTIPPTNQVMTPRAGLAHARDQSLLLGFPPSTPFPDVQHSLLPPPNLQAHRPVSSASVVMETQLGRQGRGYEVSNSRAGDGISGGTMGVLTGVSTLQGAARMSEHEPNSNRQRGLSSLGTESMPAVGAVVGVNPWAADLIELSPPRPEGVGQNAPRRDSAPSSAWQNSLTQPAREQSLADMLRGYNVDASTGLRGVQLAQPRREREPIPVIHMPEREVGEAYERTPPPSLDLLGLDPVPVQQYFAEPPQAEPKPPIALAPCMPGAVTPFAPFQDATQSSMAPFPPAPPVSLESPRSGHC